MKFQPSSDDIFDVLLPQIEDDMLREIAAADYGHDVEEHLAPLRLFRDMGEVPVLRWHPREVLELIRWSEPDRPDWKPGSHGKRGHLLRVFACSVLLRSYDRPENHDAWHSFNETVIQLADSLEVLGGPMMPAGAGFLAWCVERLTPLDPEGLEAPFLGLALLSLVYRLPASGDQNVIALCKWIDMKVSSLLQEKQWWATQRKDWLLSTNHHDLRNDRWIELGRRLYQWAEAQPPGEKATWIALVGRALAED